MIITPFKPYIQNIKQTDLKYEKPTLNHALKHDTVSFSGNINSYINQEFVRQTKIFQGELFGLLMSEKPIEQNLKFLTQCVFKDLNFEILDIKQVKHLDIIKKPPIVFSKVNFTPPKPLSNIYLNFSRLENIRRNAVDPKIHFNQYSNEIAQCLGENNEYSLISKYADEFRDKLIGLKTIDLDSTDKAIKEIIQKHKLDINYKVDDKANHPNSSGLHCVLNSFDTRGNCASTFVINPNFHKDFLIQHLPHEFTHLLNHNSYVFNNQVEAWPKNLGKLWGTFQAELTDTARKKDLFIDLPTTDRKKEYDAILNKLVKSSPTEKNKIINYLESAVKNEAFAYSKSPEVLKGYENNKNEIPYGLIFKDFLNYLLSVKYNSEKFAAIGL